MGEKGKVSIGFRLFILGFEITVATLILGGAWLIDKFLLAPSLILAFRLVRVKIETKYDVYHCATILACMIVSTLICWLGTYLSLPINISFISSVIIGVAFAIITWHVQDIINLKRKYDEINEELEILKASIASDETFNAESCTEEELVARCRELGMSADAIELAIEFFIRKTKQSVIADKMCIEEKSVQQHKRRLRKKLNK